jgi:hypothetical protein
MSHAQDRPWARALRRLRRKVINPGIDPVENRAVDGTPQIVCGGVRAQFRGGKSNHRIGTAENETQGLLADPGIFTFRTVDGKNEWSPGGAARGAHRAETQMMNVYDIKIRHPNRLVMREGNCLVTQPAKALEKYGFGRVPDVAA